MIYRYKGNTADVSFDKFDNALDIIDKTRNGKTDLADVKNNQEKFKSYLGEIKKGNNKHKSKEQRNTSFNIEMLYKARNEAITFYDYYSLMILKLEQLKEQDLKYQHQNKCFEDYQ